VNRLVSYASPCAHSQTILGADSPSFRQSENAVRSFHKKNMLVYLSEMSDERCMDDTFWQAYPVSIAANDVSTMIQILLSGDIMNSSPGCSVLVDAWHCNIMNCKVEPTLASLKQMTGLNMPINLGKGVKE
jgi:hypothetical protein